MRTKLFTKIFVALIVSVGMFSIYSCSSDDDEPVVVTPSLSIGMPDGSAAPTSLKMPAEEGTQTLSIVSNSEWKISKKEGDADWLTVTPQQGNKNGEIKISVTKNSKASEREVTLVFSVGDKENFKTYTVTQEAYGPSLSVSPENPELLDTNENEITFTIDAKEDEWEYSVADNPEWITEKEKSATKLVLTIKKNSGDEREASIVFKLTEFPSITKSVTINQSSPTLSVSPEDVEMLSDKGEDITFTVDANNEWEYSISNSPNWLKQKNKTETSLTLTVDLNSGAERSALVTFKLVEHPSVTKVIEITQAEKTKLVADMLDVEFNLDGSAKDLSPMNHIVQKMEFDNPFTVVYNDTYKRNMVVFNPEENGKSQSADEASYYRIDYQNNTEFQQKLATGHTFETLVKFDVDYRVEQGYETKFFSTHERGGTGFLIARAGHASGSNGLTFLPNVPATDGGASNWIWANSNVQPDGQSWYHLVGVWDKDAGKAYIYVNGERKAEVNAQGFYRPIDLADAWLAIGGDPGNKIIQAPFAGSMAIARIYDRALTEAEAEFLWNEIN